MRIEIDLGLIRAHHEAYSQLWAEAQRDSRKETFAILAACRSADDVPALLAAVEGLLRQAWLPASTGEVAPPAGDEINK